jgi:predicted transcriptional regulator
MKRTTIKISDELDAKLRHTAQRTGRTISEVTRDALELYLNGRPRRRFRSAGPGRSDDGGVARRIKEILAEEWR